MDKNTVLALVVVAALGVGGYLYFQRQRGGASAQPSQLPDRVQQKRAAGAAMAQTSDAYRPELPPQVQQAFDTAGLVYKRGADVVAQGRQAVDAARQGDVAGFLGGAANIAGGLGYGGSGQGSYRPNASAGPAKSYESTKPPQAVTFKAPVNPLLGLPPTKAAAAEILAKPQARSGANRF